MEPYLVILGLPALKTDRINREATLSFPLPLIADFFFSNTAFLPQLEKVEWLMGSGEFTTWALFSLSACGLWDSYDFDLHV